MSRFAFVLMLVAIALPSCSPPVDFPECPAAASVDGVFPSILADPAVARLDAAAPWFSAQGCGSILLLDGWQRIEAPEGKPASVWAGDTNASFEVPRPIAPLPPDSEDTGSDFILTVDAAAILQSDEPQWIELFAADRSLGRRPLGPTWQKVDFEIPADVLAEDWNLFRFEFAWARSPKSLGVSEDKRNLAVAVARMAVRPTGLDTSPRTRLLTHKTRPILELPPGAVVAWPLPRQARIEVSLPVEAEALDPDGCRWTAALVGPGQSAGTSLEDLEPSADRLRLKFTTKDRWDQLAVGWCLGNASAADASWARMTLGTDVLTWNRERTPAAKTQPPDVFIYLVDTLRADALPIYGGTVPAPSVEELAAGSVTYEQAWTASTWTLPATVSLLTGASPDRHGVTTGKTKFNDSSITPLAERLSREGYLSIGLSQSMVASQRYGIDRGFEHFRLSNQLGSNALRSHRLRTFFLRYLLSEPANANRPIFTYFHSVDPHGPYKPADGFETEAEARPGTLERQDYSPRPFNTTWPRPDRQDIEKLRAYYDGEVTWTDQQLGHTIRLLRHLGLYDGSFFVFTSDHGEEFGEHDGFDHGRTLYEEQLRVPLLVRLPEGARAGTRVGTPVSTTDVVPTILREIGAADLDEEALGGRDLTADGSGRWVADVVNPVASDPLRSVDYLALRRGPLKCLVSRKPHDQFGRPVPELRAFDLETDPGEQSPLPDDDPRVEDCRNAWADFDRARHVPDPGAGPATDQETLDELEALGYIG